MKRFLLTLTLVFTILFTQAQCQANFSYLQVGSTTVFADLSTIQSTNYSVTWSWDFGDGNTSTQQNPVHTYSNGIYFPCLTVTFFDSTMINYCTSIYCDSILVGNAPPASWDCTPATGCYDPGTGNGQYTTLSACQAACMTAPSWDCSLNMLGCYDPGTGLGQYTSLAACQSVCGTPIPSWDCGPVGCYDPQTGLGQYTTLASCQSNCIISTSNYCDSMIVTGSQYVFTAEVNNINTIIEYWSTSLVDGTVIEEDSMTNTHDVLSGIALDTVNVCITYVNAASWHTCCVTWVWNGSYWAKIGSLTLIEDINSFNRKLLKVIDVLGRNTNGDKNKLLFYIYEDGTIEKKIILE